MKNEKAVRLLIVEDDEYVRESLVLGFEKRGFEVSAIGTLEDTQNLLRKKGKGFFHYALIDHDLSGCPLGYEVFALCSFHAVKFISVLSSMDRNNEIYDQYKKLGVHKFFRKDLYQDNFDGISRFIYFSVFEGLITETLEKDLIITDSNVINIINSTLKTSHNDISFLLQGESGTGKGELAKTINRLALLSGRKSNFQELDCTKYEENALIVELFGNEKGIYSGGHSNRDGKIKKAEGGTLFIDEIGKMNFKGQAMLLKFLDARRYEVWGAKDSTESDVLLVFGSSENLYERTFLPSDHDNHFMPELYNRISPEQVRTIYLKPIRERKEVVLPLISRLLELSPERCEFEPKAIKALVDYDWPANIREIKAVIQQVSALAVNCVIPYSALPNNIKFKKDQNVDSAKYQSLLSEEQFSLILDNGADKFIEMLKADIFKKAKQKLISEEKRSCNVDCYKLLNISLAKGRKMRQSYEEAKNVYLQ